MTKHPHTRLPYPWYMIRYDIYDIDDIRYDIHSYRCITFGPIFVPDVPSTIHVLFFKLSSCTNVAALCSFFLFDFLFFVFVRIFEFRKGTRSAVFSYRVFADLFLAISDIISVCYRPRPWKTKEEKIDDMRAKQSKERQRYQRPQDMDLLGTPLITWLLPVDE